VPWQGSAGPALLEHFLTERRVAATDLSAEISRTQELLTVSRKWVDAADNRRRIVSV
jgi:hypothetical protein